MNKFMIKIIEKYQEGTKNSAKRCRYIPSCSEYAKGCYKKFNFFKATFLTIYRIVRCNPLSKGGFDPVPLTRKEKKLTKENELPYEYKDFPNSPF